MFTEKIAMSGVRKRSQFQTSLHACVFHQQDVDPFSDADATSDIKQVNVLVPYEGEGSWNFNFEPQIGDIVELPRGQKYKVSKVSDSIGMYELVCRSI